jgi:hypothetical protein
MAAASAAGREAAGFGAVQWQGEAERRCFPRRLVVALLLIRQRTLHEVARIPAPRARVSKFQALAHEVAATDPQRDLCPVVCNKAVVDRPAACFKVY